MADERRIPVRPRPIISRLSINPNSYGRQLIAYKNGSGGEFPQLTYTLDTLFHDHKDPSVIITDFDVEVMLKAFLVIIFDLRDAFLYLTRDDDRPSIPDVPEYDCAYFDEVMDQCFMNWLAYQDTVSSSRYQGLFSEIDLTGTQQFVWYEVLPQIYDPNDAQLSSKELMGWRLFHWFIRAATHSMVLNRGWVNRVLRTMQGSNFLALPPVEDFRPQAYLEPFVSITLDESESEEEPEFAEDFPDEDEPAQCVKINIEDYAKSFSQVAFEAECSICRTNEQYTWVKLNQCKHAFHKDCLSTWANMATRVATCPMCRGVICDRKEVGVELGQDWGDAVVVPDGW